MDEMSGLTASPCYFSFAVEAVPIIRGYLAAALEDLPHTCDAALEVCAAWAELDEAAQLPPTIHDIEPPESPLAALQSARALLHDAMLTAETVARVMAFARALRHLDDALHAHTVAAGGARATTRTSPARSATPLRP